MESSKVGANIFKGVQKNAIDKILMSSGGKPVFIFIYLDVCPNLPQHLIDIAHSVPEDKAIFVKEEYGALRLTSYGS